MESRGIKISKTKKKKEGYRRGASKTGESIRLDGL